ncbi:hypothetical protein CDL12_14743 [Handroanthus impetiginosus]|uniref:Hapless 8 n=1 Tax=Handroanthus impetiginosus TaxID=429701 RepID=A0A2G9H547_9LAMI|nr:hypothetical protein CDL12_14743 [Handroanthus impetiginosus]
MLSTENPPPDLRCSCEISQSKSSSSDERASDNNNNDNNQVDLFKSGLDDSNSLPKFSIREYVFKKRGKNIKNNWPFSQKNLQLCLKNGVKDVLPPFQSLDSMRSPSIEKCAVENLKCSDVKLSESSDHSVVQKSAVDIEKINSSGSQENKDFASTTSQSCSDINSVPPIKSPEAEYFPTEKSESAVLRASNKVEKSTQSPVKKCRLIVKLNNIAEPKSNEDLGVNTCVVSETMASKVCPVCKTFSSTSNTTLNAHIDQCLSGESTIKWTTNSKVIKHRIKPRKTRLMVDIYETALHCTLEDLDRRNGTNWASNLGFPAEDLEEGADEKNMMYSAVNTEDLNEEGRVYIDSDGTKVRILSKLSDLPSNSNANYDSRPSKLVKPDKGSKFLSSKKKKYLVHKRKVLKHSPCGQGSCFPSPNHLMKCPPNGQKSCHSGHDQSPYHKVDNGQQKNILAESYLEDRLIAYNQMNSNDSGMIKQWVGSKRTGLQKKINLDHENQHADKIIKNLRVKSGCSSVSETLGERTSVSKSQISSDENPLLRTESHKRRENSLWDSHDECMEQPCQRKRPGFPLLDCHGIKDNLTFSKYNLKLARKDGPSVHERQTDPPNGTEDHVSSRNNKKMGINNGGSFISSKTFSSQGKEFASPRKTFLNNAISSGSNKFSSLRKKLFSVRHTSVAESKKNLERKYLDLKKPRLRFASGSDEEAVVSQSAIYRPRRNAAQMEKARTRVLKIRKKRGGFVNTGEGETSLKCSEISPQSDGLGIGKNINSCMGGGVPVDASNVLEEVEKRDEAFIAFSKSLDSAFTELSGPSNVECVLQHYNKAYERHCPSELVLGGEQEMFCADKVGKDLVTPDSHLVINMDADEAQRDYFVDVDPIPIPGPPGSFLPSPGRMGSEELQGNSSLTTCRIQSSEDEQEAVDMDSSDSPISAASAVSNSVAVRSDSVSAINLSVQSLVQHETQRDISEDRIGSGVEGSSSFKQATASRDREVNIHDSTANLTLPEVSAREFENIQPCCCSRKEGALQSDSFNYQESQLLRRRSMTSPSVLAQQKQMADDLYKKISSFNCRSEELLEKEPTPESEKNSANSRRAYASGPASQNSEAKFPSYGDCESPSPSTSNPVLRLMGKNLMVVNKDENLSPQTWPTQSCVMKEHPGLRLSVDNQNEPHLVHHTLSRGPYLAGDMPACQHFDFNFNSSNGFKLPANYRPLQLSVHPSTVMLPSKSFGGSFPCSSNCCEYTRGCSLIPDQLGSKIRLDSQSTYDFDPQLKTPYSSGSKHKEIIVIDDSPESEAGFAIKATQCNSNMEAGKSSVAGVNPFYHYPQVPPPKGMTSKWNCSTPEGLSVLDPNSLPVHLRSSLYFPPGFS